MTQSSSYPAQTYFNLRHPLTAGLLSYFVLYMASTCMHPCVTFACVAICQGCPVISARSVLRRLALQHQSVYPLPGAIARIS